MGDDVLWASRCAGCDHQHRNLDFSIGAHSHGPINSVSFADAIACNTGAAGTYLLGSQIDIRAVRDVGNGEELYLVISVDTGIKLALSTGTISFSLASDDSAFDLDEHEHDPLHHAGICHQRYSWTRARLLWGMVLAVVALPWEGNAYERYLGILENTGTTAISAGKINAFLTKMVKWKAYDSPSQA